MNDSRPQRLNRAGRAVRTVLQTFEDNARQPMYAAEIVAVTYLNDSSVAGVLHRLGDLGWLQPGEPQATTVGPPRVYWSVSQEGAKALDRMARGEPIS